MLTGDNARVAAAIARAGGHAATYRADLMPEDKLAVIRELLEQYGQVAMVGDGVNDAPALANATVGIAMGGAGTDVALETADVALMADDLGKLPFAVGLGRATRAIIIQNLAIALGVIGLLIVTSVDGHRRHRHRHHLPRGQHAGRCGKCFAVAGISREKVIKRHSAQDVFDRP